MIAQARAEHPDVSLEELCELFSVGRSWYHERPTPEEEEEAHGDVELRDAMERIVLEFPGYADTGGPPPSFMGEAGPRTTSGY